MRWSGCRLASGVVGAEKAALQTRSESILRKRGRLLFRDDGKSGDKAIGDGYAEKQRWVGRRIHPEDCAFTILPWGFVPQQIVKEKIVPLALKRKSDTGESSIFTPSKLLKIFGSSAEDFQQGAELAYRFVGNEFSKGQAVFEEKYSDQVDKHLGACFDLQLRQLEAPRVEIHKVHDVVLTSAFPLLLCDPTNPENMEKSSNLWKYLGINAVTAQLHFAKIMLSRLLKQTMNGQDEGLRLAVEVIIRTDETCNFGPDAGILREDAEHVLWFYGGRKQDILTSLDLDFELVNMNEALSMIQDTATPEAWALNEA